MQATNKFKRRILLQLFIVLTISVVAILFLLKISEVGRENSRNLSRVNQIQEYQKAFNLLYSQTGKYPFGGEQTPTCLGSYSEKRCWQDNSLLENDLIKSSIIPKYMPRLPDGEKRKFGENKSYTGMVYTPGAKGKSYRILYFMEGKDKSCIIDKAVGINNGLDTLCVLKIP